MLIYRTKWKYRVFEPTQSGPRSCGEKWLDSDLFQDGQGQLRVDVTALDQFVQSIRQRETDTRDDGECSVGMHEGKLFECELIE